MYSSNLEKNPFIQKLLTIDLPAIAKRTKFHQRVRKVEASDFLLSFFHVALNGTYSLSNWAIQLSLQAGNAITKQGLWKRLTKSHSEFLKEVLKEVICCDLSDFSMKTNIDKNHLFEKFGRVLIHDSTTIHLPDCLSNVFKGNWATGKLRSLAKIQAVINIKNHSFTHLELSDFSENDQSWATRSLSFIKKGGLVIRDLGYYATNIFRELINKEAYFISKLRFGTHVYNPDGQRINLAKLLKNKSILELDVLLSKKRIPVRLVAQRVNDSVAEQRIRNARNDRDKRLNHNDEYYPTA